MSRYWIQLHWILYQEQEQHEEQPPPKRSAFQAMMAAISRERTSSTYEVNEKNLFDALYNQVLKAIISSYKKSQMAGERKAYSDFCQIYRNYDRLCVNGSFSLKGHTLELLI